MMCQTNRKILIAKQPISIVKQPITDALDKMQYSVHKKCLQKQESRTNSKNCVYWPTPDAENNIIAEKSAVQSYAAKDSCAHHM